MACAYNVTIANSSLGNSVGSGTGDGFFDPTTVQQYMYNTLQTGSTFGTIVVGQVIMINDYPVTVLTGTTVGNLATDINALTSKHHAIAGTSTGNLTLINAPLYYNGKVSVTDGTAGITAQVGFVSPTISTVAFPTSLNQTLAKARGNWRWKMLLEQLGMIGVVTKINAITVTGVDLTFATNTTQIQFNVFFDGAEVYGTDLSGNQVYGTQAVYFAVTNAILGSYNVTEVVYNPTVPVGVGNPPAYNLQSVQLTVGALTAVAATAEGNVTVTNVVA